MGIDRRIGFAPRKLPTFEAVRDRLAKSGFPVQVRMMDGQLAFPDEIPPEYWHELRLGTPQGMITVRREGDDITCVTWGNADRLLLQGWNAVTWAFAVAGDGTIHDPDGSRTAAEFFATADLPATLQSKGAIREPG
jgi:hypothetical protein